MKRLLILLLLLLCSAGIASARDSVKGWCEEGNRPVVTSGLNSTTRVQASHPSCTITVYTHGAGLATIYADNNGTPLANPFTAQSGGRWQAYADNGRYDVTMSSAGFTQTVTYSDIILCDPFEVGSSCNNGGATTAHNLLSDTHLDTIAFSPPGRGDVVTAQNLTSPTGVTPAWARLALGNSGYVLTSNGTDVIWAPTTAAAHNMLSATHLDSIAASPPARGSLIVAQNQTSPTGVNPSWAELALGSTNYVLTSNGTDAVWAAAVTPIVHTNHGISFTIGTPGGTALSSGSTTTDYLADIPFACTINSYALAIDAGTITIKFWKVAGGTAIPTSANSINTSGVSISSGTRVQSGTLSDFTTTAVAAHDQIAMNVSTVATAAYVNGVLSCQE